MIKDNIIQQILHLSANLPDQHEDQIGIDASQIAALMQISRSAASRYLNELNRSGDMVKVNTRPVYFHLKRHLEEHYKKPVVQTSFSSYEELFHYLRNEESKKRDPFSVFIGAEGSMSTQIEQLKAAISYPPRGLPIMITGETGVGKSNLAQLTYEYALESNLIVPESPFLTMNCAEFADNPELVTANLFGYVSGAFTGAVKDTKGIIEAANGGILFLDEVHRLSAEGQEKLFLFMDQGVFHPLGDNQKWKRSDVRLLFATTEGIEETFLPTFLRRIPIITSIPPLRERSDDEKFRLIYLFYEKESRNIGVKLCIQHDVIRALMAYRPNGNVGELKNVVTTSCAKAYQESISVIGDGIHIQQRHLPKGIVEYYLLNKQKHVLELPDESISIHPAVQIVNDLPFLNQATGKLKGIYQSLIELLASNADPKDDISELTILVNQEIDRIMYSNQKVVGEVEFLSLKQLITTYMEYRPVEKSIIFPGSFIIGLTHYLFEACSSALLATEEGTTKQVLDAVRLLLPDEVTYANRVVNKIKDTFDVYVNKLDIAVIALYLSGLKKNKSSDRIRSVIVSHGFATASSIAHVANSVLGENIFEAFDMPLNVSPLDIIHKIEDYMEAIDTTNGVIFLVDMGSLTDLQKHLQPQGTGPIGLLNNITTSMAIEVGESILREDKIEQILKRVTASIKPTYKLIKDEQNKTNAIITTCGTGMGTAVKIKELLMKGIGNTRKITVLPYDFLSLKNNGLKEDVFTSYNVLGIVGTLDPKVQHIPFVAMEDIISDNDTNKLNEIFSGILPPAKIEELNETMLKLFSLESVINHLTILNPDKLIDNLSDILGRIQQELNITFSNPTLMSLYIHMSCLVERLVKKSPIEYYSDMEQFGEEHKTFVHLMKRIFYRIEESYGVEIPLSEIGYIYDIIKIRNETFVY
ncbi:sigma 54-interacting transcriptional regulator [Terribacillus saccharophilus]|uniref:sigma 54-interacting transcriptional regulator n=1 Tax=Terribacillus saccharophilus TaxID=361277 RepID=UPI0038000C67